MRLKIQSKSYHLLQENFQGLFEIQNTGHIHHCSETITMNVTTT